MVTNADLEWWLATAPSLEWTFAKTMQDSPHSYVVRNKTFSDPDFERAVKVIRTFGQPGKFWNSTNIYLVSGDVKWWTMGEPLDECQIINTATTEKVYGRQDAPPTASGITTVYDDLATVYDDRYRSPEDLAENDQVRRLVIDHFGPYAPKTLDIGCGTGLLLDMGLTAPGVYTGVDPSQGMLNELIRKHPRVRDIHPSTWESVNGKVEANAPYELVVSLFGSPSYIHATDVSTIPALSESGLVVLMHYREGYWPDYEDKPVTMDESREAAARLGGRTFRLNNFDVTVVRT